MASCGRQSETKQQSDLLHVQSRRWLTRPPAFLSFPQMPLTPSFGSRQYIAWHLRMTVACNELWREAGGTIPQPRLASTSSRRLLQINELLHEFLRS